MSKSLLAGPLTRTKRMRWDAKFVRLDGYFAPYLRWLFPNFKIISLVRDSLNFSLSYRRMEPTYDKHPHKTGPLLTPRWHINSAERFFAMSYHLVASFLHVARANDMKIIRYKTIKKDRAQTGALGDFLELTLDAAVMDRKLNGMIREFPPAAPLNKHGRQVIENWASRFE